jgi:hypothetical protein
MDEKPIETAQEKEGHARGRTRRRRGWGVALLCVAALALIERHTAYRASDALLLLLGLAFIGWAIMGRVCGLLIPGGILTGLGVGVLAERWLGHGGGQQDGVFLLCFAGGWVLIPVLTLGVFRRVIWWPLIPAALIGLTGLGQLGYPEWGWALRDARNYWPYALIALAAP